jgi:hypothetical protein
MLMLLLDLLVESDVRFGVVRESPGTFGQRNDEQKNCSTTLLALSTADC